MNIAIIKYGMGNVASVEKMIAKIGFDSIITNNHKEIEEADFILLPGVGSFKKGIENLRESGLIDLLTEEVVVKKKPFLGICLGMQLLATYGNEPEKENGLGWIEGEVVKIELQKKMRIPHMGWNNVKFVNTAPVFYEEFDEQDYYFIHGYHFIAANPADVVLKVTYDIPMVAALQKNNIYAMQFHPEKSQEAGMKLLKKIINQYA